MKAAVAKVWIFASSSNPQKVHETLQYIDGTVSCSCPGWTRRCASDGSRSCRHTRLFDTGKADEQCERSRDYAQVNAAARVNVSVLPVTRINRATGLGHRKFAI